VENVVRVSGMRKTNKIVLGGGRKEMARWTHAFRGGAYEKKSYRSRMGRRGLDLLQLMTGKSDKLLRTRYGKFRFHKLRGIS
jgi:hypothetical protein